MIYGIDQLAARKVMRMDELDAGKNISVKTIRFKKKILNCFFTG